MKRDEEVGVGGGGCGCGRGRGWVWELGGRGGVEKVGEEAGSSQKSSCLSKW